MPTLRAFPSRAAWSRVRAFATCVAFVCAVHSARSQGPGGGGGGPGGGGAGGGAGGGGAGGGTIVIPGGGGGAITLPGGGAITLPGGGTITIPGGGITLPGGGVNNPTANATINAPRGAIVGEPVTLSVTVNDPNPPTTATPTYQWSVYNGRLIGDARAATVQVTADRTGVVTIGLAHSANGSSFNLTAEINFLAAGLAGEVTAPATVATNATTVTASVPAAQNNDRTFRWTVSGDATIASGQNTRSITLRPGTPGLKEIVCNVTLQNLVTVPVRSYLVVTGSGAPVAVDIEGGVGDGLYPPGTRVDIFANPPPAGQAFDRWVGNIEALGTGPLQPLLSHTVITVPATPVTLTATYKAVPTAAPTVMTSFNPQIQATSAAASGATTTVTTTFTHRIPEEMRGVVFLLHGTGGSSADWFNKPEQSLLVRDLLAAGYGVATLDSINRAAGTWSAQPTLITNLDALNHVAAIQRLIAQQLLTAQQPIFFLGVGSGANAALRYADLLATARPAYPVRGALLYLASGIDVLAATSSVPQFFALAANDDVLGATGLATAREHAQLLAGRGIANNVVTNAVSPVHPTRFRALGLTSNSFTAADADTLWNAVKDAGYLDANNYPKSVPSLSALTAALPASHRSRATDVEAQLSVAAAADEFFSDSNPRVINFLNARVANAAAPAPGRLVNLAARGRVAHATDSFTLGFTLRGTGRATMLLRGVGPSLRRFGVVDALGAASIELRQGNTLIAANDGWTTAPNAAQIATTTIALGAFALTQADTDAALLVQLDPGSYTLTVRSLGGNAGQALGEIYDVSRNAARLTNLSVLSRLDEAGSLLIPGIVIAGNNPRALVVRAIGPGLTDLAFPATTVIGDPRLVIYNGNQVVGTNNNWGQASAASLTAVFPAIGAFPLRAAADAAILDSLQPGAYTIQAGPTPAAAIPGTAISGGASDTGFLLVEVYEVP